MAQRNSNWNLQPPVPRGNGQPQRIEYSYVAERLPGGGRTQLATYEVEQRGPRGAVYKETHTYEYTQPPRNRKR